MVDFSWTISQGQTPDKARAIAQEGSGDYSSIFWGARIVGENLQEPKDLLNTETRSRDVGRSANFAAVSIPRPSICSSRGQLPNVNDSVARSRL